MLHTNNSGGVSGTAIKCTYLVLFPTYLMWRVLTLPTSSNKVYGSARFISPIIVFQSYIVTKLYCIDVESAEASAPAKPTSVKPTSIKKTLSKTHFSRTVEKWRMWRIRKHIIISALTMLWDCIGCEIHRMECSAARWNPCAYWKFIEDGNKIS